MPVIKEPIVDILNRLKTITVNNGDGYHVQLYVRVWNNQVKDEFDGKTYDFPKPATFLEVIKPASFTSIGQGYRSVDITFRVHIVHEQFDAGDGTMEQNLAVFDFRDAIIAKLHLYKAPGCSSLMAGDEETDDDHTQVYHYIIDFKCNFTDTAGSVEVNFIDSIPPYDATIVGEFKTEEE